MAVQFIPSQDRWANLGSEIGQNLGKAYADSVDTELNRQAALKAQEVLKKINDDQKNPDGTQYAQTVAGVDLQQNPAEILAKNSVAWDEYGKKIGDLNGQLTNAPDETTKSLINAQIQQATEIQRKVAADSEKWRGFLGAKDPSLLKGYGADDNSYATWMQSHPGLATLSQKDNNGNVTNTNGLVDLTNAKNDYEAATTDEERVNAANRANTVRGLLSGKGINYNLLNLGSDKSVNESLFQPTVSTAPSNDNKYMLTPADLMANADIAKLANEKAMNYARDNFNYGDTVDQITNELLKAKIDPKVIASMQGRINEQAKNIGMQYAMKLAQNGDYTKAAEYAVQHGLPSDILQSYQALATKHNIEGINTGKAMTFVDKSSNNFGQATVPKDVTIGTTAAQDNADARQKEALRTDLYKFEKNFDQHVKEFGFDSAVKKAELVLKSDKFTLDQKEHVAGKIRAGIDVIKTKNDSLSKQIAEIYKNAPGSGLTPSQQQLIDSYREEIKANNLDLSKYSAVVDNSLGIAQKQPDDKATTQVIDIKMSDYNKLYNKLIGRGLNDSKAREYLSTHYNITD